MKEVKEERGGEEDWRKGEAESNEVPHAKKIWGYPGSTWLCPGSRCDP